MPFICKTKRQTDYNLKPSSCPIVIDNGASYFRIGYVIFLLYFIKSFGFYVNCVFLLCGFCRWAGETEPRIIFRNIVQRPRHKITGNFFVVFGLG